MDPKTEFETLKQELMDLGFTQDKLDELLMLATEEIIDRTLDALEQSEDDQKLEELATLLETPTNNEEEAIERLNKVFSAAYGEDVENKKLELLNTYLKETIQATKDTKDLLKRYQDGDPTAVASIQSNMGDPDAQKIQESLTE